MIPFYYVKLVTLHIVSILLGLIKLIEEKIRRYTQLMAEPSIREVINWAKESKWSRVFSAISQAAPEINDYTDDRGKDAATYCRYR